MKIERQRYLLQRKDRQSKWKQRRDKMKIEGKSLGIFEPTNWFRIWCHRFVKWTFFDVIIDSFIILNCVFLAMESPAASQVLGNMFTVADIFFTTIFLLEFMLKVVALGAFKHPFRSKRQWKKITDDDELLEWTDKAYQATFMMHCLNADILDLPGLAIECAQSNDGYHVVQYWGTQVLRIVYYEGSWMTCYKLTNQVCWSLTRCSVMLTLHVTSWRHDAVCVFDVF